MEGVPKSIYEGTFKSFCEERAYDVFQLKLHFCDDAILDLQHQGDGFPIHLPNAEVLVLSESLCFIDSNVTDVLPKYLDKLKSFQGKSLPSVSTNQLQYIERLNIEQDISSLNISIVLHLFGSPHFLRYNGQPLTASSFTSIAVSAIMDLTLAQRFQFLKDLNDMALLIIKKGFEKAVLDLVPYLIGALHDEQVFSNQFILIKVLMKLVDNYGQAQVFFGNIPILSALFPNACLQHFNLKASDRVACIIDICYISFSHLLFYSSNQKLRSVLIRSIFKFLPMIGNYYTFHCLSETTGLFLLPNAIHNRLCTRDEAYSMFNNIHYVVTQGVLQMPAELEQLRKKMPRKKLFHNDSRHKNTVDSINKDAIEVTAFCGTLYFVSHYIDDLHCIRLFLKETLDCIVNLKDTNPQTSIRNDLINCFFDFYNEDNTELRLFMMQLLVDKEDLPNFSHMLLFELVRFGIYLFQEFFHFNESITDQQRKQFSVIFNLSETERIGIFVLLSDFIARDFVSFDFLDNETCMMLFETFNIFIRKSVFPQCFLDQRFEHALRVLPHLLPSQDISTILKDCPVFSDSTFLRTLITANSELSYVLEHLPPLPVQSFSDADISLFENATLDDILLNKEQYILRNEFIYYLSYLKCSVQEKSKLDEYDLLVFIEFFVLYHSYSVNNGHVLRSTFSFMLSCFKNTLQNDTWSKLVEKWIQILQQHFDFQFSEIPNVENFFDTIDLTDLPPNITKLKLTFFERKPIIHIEPSLKVYPMLFSTDPQ
ncbi:hypothetical protein PCE1_002089 [Barthelona sp. PCE]